MIPCIRFRLSSAANRDSILRKHQSYSRFYSKISRLVPEVLSQQAMCARRGGEGYAGRRRPRLVRPRRHRTASAVRAEEPPATVVRESDPSDTLLVYGEP